MRLVGNGGFFLLSPFSVADQPEVEEWHIHITQVHLMTLLG